MKKIIFVCHGSICRSPAAEFIAKKYLKEHNLEDSFMVTSLALSNEEIGNDIYPPMKRELYKRNIPFEPHSARKITEEDYESADYIFYMDELNRRYLIRLFSDYKKIIDPISLYTKRVLEIEDPWYTNNYSLVVDQIEQCINDIFKFIK